MLNFAALAVSALLLYRLIKPLSVAAALVGATLAVAYPLFVYTAGTLYPQTTASTLFLAPILAVFLFSMVIVAVFIIARELRLWVFNFPPSGALTSAGSAEARRKLLYERQYEAMEADPGEIIYLNCGECLYMEGREFLSDRSDHLNIVVKMASQDGAPHDMNLSDRMLSLADSPSLKGFHPQSTQMPPSHPLNG
jgi:hypothetical protein